MYTAIDQVLSGHTYICDEVKNIFAELNLTDDNNEEKHDLNKLSDRELDIVRLLKKGNSSKEIASHLSLSVRTVDAHRYNILKKLNLKNAAALVNLINESDRADSFQWQLDELGMSQAVDTSFMLPEVVRDYSICL